MAYTSYLVLSIRRANKAYRLTVATESAVFGIDTVVVEVHAVRVAAISARGRPVVANSANIINRSPAAEAGGWEEDRASRLKGILTNHLAHHVTRITRTVFIGIVQTINGYIPVVRHEDDTIYIVYLSLGIAYA